MQATQRTNKNNKKQLWQRGSHLQSKDVIPTNLNQLTQNQKQLAKSKLSEVSLTRSSWCSDRRTTIHEKNQLNQYWSSE